MINFKDGITLMSSLLNQTAPLVRKHGRNTASLIQYRGKKHLERGAAGSFLPVSADDKTV